MIFCIFAQILNIMKKLCIYLLFSSILVVIGCSSPNESPSYKAKIDSLTNVINTQALLIEKLSDSLTIYKYPANQRLAHINTLFSEEKYLDAKSEISELQRIFPNSDEATLSVTIFENINARLAEIEEEKQRIKALGYKALNTHNTVTIGYNEATFGSFTIGKKFIHDVYPTYSGSSWFEHTADRNHQYISVPMNITSTSNNPDIPTLAFYAIKGEQLQLKGTFWIQMARWDDYGSYLGNEPDLNNDFSKVSSVKFKLGLELEDSDFKSPYVIVLKKQNTHSRQYDRFENPPISYIGSDHYPSTLTIDNFNNGDYVAIRIANLK